MEEAGNEECCEYCGASVMVPEASQAKILSADDIQDSSDSIAQVRLQPEPKELADAEIQKLARAESQVPLSQMDFQGYPLASLASRLFAKIIDGVLLAVAAAVGVFVLVWGAQVGIVPAISPAEETGLSLAHWAVLGFVPLLLNVAQWYLIATRGQSIGKFCLCIRVVSTDGKLPGAISGVVVREWVRYLLCMIPFFGLLDVVLIFTESKRCIHDYMASTCVVTA